MSLYRCPSCKQLLRLPQKEYAKLVEAGTPWCLVLTVVLLASVVGLSLWAYAAS